MFFAIAGPHQGAVFPLHGTSMWLGRGSQVDVDVEDDAVSSRHAHVTQRSDGIYLQDAAKATERIRHVD